MTSSEFDEWLLHAQGTFPDIRAWFDDQNKVPDPAATLKQWERVLLNCSLVDCIAAINAMIDGKIEVPMVKSNIPTIVRRYAEKNEVLRRPSAEPLPRQRAYKSRHSMADMFACIRESQKAGLNHDQSLVVLNERFPIDPADETPVRCLTCMDIGTVLVWSPVSVDAVRGGFPPKKYRSTVLCSCPAGRKVQELPDKLPLGSKILPRYHEKKYCKYGRGEVEPLEAWVAERKRNATKEHPNYNPDFDSFGPDF